MATFVYSATMSLDGFIAGADGDMSWMVPYLGPDPAMDSFVAEVGAVLVGGGTLRGRDPYEGSAGEGEVFGGGWEGPQIAVTRHPVEGLTCTPDLDEGIRRAREAAGDRVVNVLGATLARSLLERGVLDEVLTSIAPVLLGCGTRLFDQPGGTPVRLEPIGVDHVPLATSLRYRVVHREAQRKGATQMNSETTSEQGLSATARVVWPATKEPARSAQNPPRRHPGQRQSTDARRGF